MALDAILSAIANKTNDAIETRRRAKKISMADLKQAHEDAILTLESNVATQCHQKKNAILQKAKSHASAHIKNSELMTRQAELDALYAGVVSEFDSLPEKEIESIYATMLAKLPTSGVLRAAKKHAKIFKKIASQYEVGEPLEESGFMLITDLADYDCTIATIVYEQMRPKTEISVSQKLFS